MRAIFQVEAPGGLYLEGLFNGGFFALPVWGAFIWRRLYIEGPIFRILRYYGNLGKNLGKNYYENLGKNLGKNYYGNLGIYLIYLGYLTPM